MSVVLFRCLKCNNYSTSAMVNLVVSATLKPRRGRLWPHDISYPEDGIPLENIVESYCGDCDSPTELVTLDECPHWWGKAKGSQPPYRVCVLCGEKQEGHVIFDE